MISIPHGTIKTACSTRRAQLMHAISIPHGTIKTFVRMSELAVWSLISIPHGTIKTLSFLNDRGCFMRDFNSTWYD